MHSAPLNKNFSLQAFREQTNKKTPNNRKSYSPIKFVDCDFSEALSS